MHFCFHPLYLWCGKGAHALLLIRRQRHIERVRVHMQLSLRESECTFYQNCEVTHTFLGKRTACPQISAPALLPKIRRKLFRRQTCDAPLAELWKNVKVNDGFIAGIRGRLHIRMT